MRILTTFLYLPLSLLIFLNAHAAPTEWQQLHVSDFKINYTEADRLYAEELASLSQNASAELHQKLGLKPLEPITIFLAPSDPIFEQLTGEFFPHWGEGVANPMQNLIILKSPSLSGNYDRFAKLVRHELIHILIGQNLPQSYLTPRWFNEGIAIYFSGDEEFAAGEAISKALLTDSLIPLDEIDDMLRFHSAKARLAYEESYSFTAFLQKEFGNEGLLRLIDTLPNSSSFDEAVERSLGVDLFELEMQWIEFVEKKYRWRFLLDFDTLIWIFIPFLFILVYILIRIRNRKTLKKWEREERMAGF